MKRALLPIALFALLTYCLPLVSLLVPVLADGSFDQSVPAASGAEEEGRSPAAQFLLQKFDQLSSLLIRDVTCRVVFDLAILDRNQVATHGHLPLLDGDTHAGGLQRPASFLRGHHGISEQTD